MTESLKFSKEQRLEIYKQVLEELMTGIPPYSICACLDISTIKVMKTNVTFTDYYEITIQFPELEELRVQVKGTIGHFWFDQSNKNIRIYHMEQIIKRMEEEIENGKSDN